MTIHEVAVPPQSEEGGGKGVDPSRRKAFTRVAQALGAAGAALASASRAAAGGTQVEVQPAPGAAPPESLRDPLLSLVHRATWGFTTDLHADAAGKGLDAWRDRQLDPTSIDDAGLDARLLSFPNR